MASIAARRPIGRAGMMLVALLPFAMDAVACDHTAASARGVHPCIGIIVDDLGYRWREGLAALELPGALTYSILPHTPYGQRFARLAHAMDREVMLHLPMESVTGKRLGAGGLTRQMSRVELDASVRRSLQSVPHVSGVSNHMGSLLTGRAEQMGWLMEIVRSTGGLYFVDSRTSPMSVAAKTARAHGVRNIVRDVFLDYERDTATIRAQFRALLRRAARQGTALGIAHPYPETVAVLAEELPQLAKAGIDLVPVSTLVRVRNGAGRVIPVGLRQSEERPRTGNNGAQPAGPAVP